MSRFATLLCVAALFHCELGLRGAQDSPGAAVIAPEKTLSKERMLQIYNAIQAYRKDHKQLPDYLSDLYPQYITDTNVFLCPAMPPGDGLPFPDLRDPKLSVQFSYEFNGNPIQAQFGYHGPMTMKEWKQMQMMVIGGAVPILRCFAFDPVVNLGFDGQFYDSPQVWEQNFADKIQPGELQPRHLRLLLMASFGVETNSESVAFEELQDAVSGNNKGVVVSDKPLSPKLKQWNQDVATTALAIADRAQKFLGNFPNSPDATQATRIEEQMLSKATRAGSDEASQRLDKFLSEKLKAPGLSDDDRFKLRVLQVDAAHDRMSGQPQSKQLAAYEQDIRSLIREFPGRLDPYLMLLSTVQDMTDQGMDLEEADATVHGLLDATNVPESVKVYAKGVLDRLNIVGHPPTIRFTALDGRQVDLSELKGKVVLVDFWATWCGPCVGEIPHVKEAYDKYHDKGFEVVGISFDTRKSALEQFVKSQNLPWPQYFDGKGWANKFGSLYGIQAIPSMWLVNREGNVVDVHARSSLADKVARLLAEN